MALWLNSERIKWGTYPNGETLVPAEQIRQLDSADQNTVRLRWDSDGDLFRLRLLATLIHRCDRLFIDYMPYSRMDRGDPTDGANVFSLSVAATLINDCEFDLVYLVEPHSDVTPALIEHAHCLFPTTGKLFDQAAAGYSFDRRTDYLVFPDAGAEKRYSPMFKGYRSIVGAKHRDFETGRIERLQLLGVPADTEDRTAIIVDDLCSYGGTFKLAARALRDAGFAKVVLVVAHAEHGMIGHGLLTDTYGPGAPDGHLVHLVDRVYCTDSMGLTPVAHGGNIYLTVMPLNVIYPELIR